MADASGSRPAARLLPGWPWRNLRVVVSCSSTPAAAEGPPAAANVAAMRWAARSRAGLSLRAGSRTPAPATWTLRATSGWSRPNGTATTGTPWARDFWVMPMPTWQTVQAARSRTGACGTNRSTRTFAGTSIPEGSTSPVVRTTSNRSPAMTAQADCARRPARLRVCHRHPDAGRLAHIRMDVHALITPGAGCASRGRCRLR